MDRDPKLPSPWETTLPSRPGPHTPPLSPSPNPLDLKLNNLSTPGPGAKKSRTRPTGACHVAVRCLVEGCKSDLAKCREYHRRHKVCEIHSKSPVAIVSGVQQRFCQQCSRFHLLLEFDNAKRSCRKRLDCHNRRRRKPPSHNFINPGGFFANYQGSRFVNFNEFPNTAIKTVPVSFSSIHPKLRRQFPFLHGEIETLIPNRTTFAGTGTVTPLSMDCALSLLSSPVQSSSCSFIRTGTGTGNENTPMARTGTESGDIPMVGTGTGKYSIPMNCTGTGNDTIQMAGTSTGNDSISMNCTGTGNDSISMNCTGTGNDSISMNCTGTGNENIRMALAVPSFQFGASSELIGGFGSCTIRSSLGGNGEMSGNFDGSSQVYQALPFSWH